MDYTDLIVLAVGIYVVFVYVPNVPIATNVQQVGEY